MKYQRKFKTFDDWRAEGRVVIKGQKSKKRNTKNQALFHLDQTKASIRYFSDGKGNFYDPDDEYSWEDEQGLTAYDLGADF